MALGYPVGPSMQAQESVSDWTVAQGGSNVIREALLEQYCYKPSNARTTRDKEQIFPRKEPLESVWPFQLLESSPGILISDF